MKDDQTPTVNADFTLENFDNEILLYSVEKTKAVYLNETAHLIWRLCSENLSVGEMITLLESKYPEQKDTIGNDILLTLQTLKDNGVISFQEDEP